MSSFPSTSASTHRTPNTTSNTIDTLLSRWQTNRTTSPLPTRLLLRALEFLCLTASLYLVPTFLHSIVQSIDELYNILGRTAWSPYTSVSGASVGVALVVVMAWHIWLGRLGYKTMLEGRQKDRRVGRWGRVLGRVVIPGVLVMFGSQFVYQVTQSLGNPGMVVVGNKHEL